MWINLASWIIHSIGTAKKICNFPTIVLNYCSLHLLKQKVSFKIFYESNPIRNVSKKSFKKKFLQVLWRNLKTAGFPQKICSFFKGSIQVYFSNFMASKLPSMSRIVLGYIRYFDGKWNPLFMQKIWRSFKGFIEFYFAHYAI